MIHTVLPADPDLLAVTFFREEDWVHPFVPFVSELLSPQADLRVSYQELTGRASPEVWRKPDWATVCPDNLVEEIVQDFLEALVPLGIFAEDECALRCVCSGDDVWIESDLYEDLVRARIGAAVRFRIRRALDQGARDQQRRKPDGDGLTVDTRSQVASRPLDHNRSSARNRRLVQQDDRRNQSKPRHGQTPRYLLPSPLSRDRKASQQPTADIV